MRRPWLNSKPSSPAWSPVNCRWKPRWRHIAAAPSLVRYCQQVLERVEQQVRVLDGDALKPLAGEGTNEQGGA